MQPTLQTMTLQEAALARCGKIASDERCYRYRHTHRPAGRRFACDGNPASHRGSSCSRWARAVYRGPECDQPRIAYRGGLPDAAWRGLGAPGGWCAYAGVVLGALGVVAVLMGGVVFGVLGSSRALRGKPAITGREGMIGEVGTVRSPIGIESEGWVFVHGERWRAVLAFAPEETNPRDREAVVGVGRKVVVVGFGDGGGVVQVMPVELPRQRQDLDELG